MTCWFVFFLAMMHSSFVVCYITVHIQHCGKCRLHETFAEGLVGGEPALTFRGPASFNWCLVGAQRTKSGSTLQLGITKDFIIEYAQ